MWIMRRVSISQCSHDHCNVLFALCAHTRTRINTHTCIHRANVPIWSDYLHDVCHKLYTTCLQLCSPFSIFVFRRNHSFWHILPKLQWLTVFIYNETFLEMASYKMKKNVEKINLSPLCLFVLLFSSLPLSLSLSLSHHPSFATSVSESPSSSLFLLHLFFSLHQNSQPETVLGLRKWMVCLFLEAGKEGKPKVSEREREQEREGGGGWGGGEGGGMWGEDKPAFCLCLWSETVEASQHN